MRELARCMSPPVSAQAISKYEAGKMMPSSAVLVGLGQALNVSLDFLMGGQVKALEAVEFRKHSGTSAKDRARAEVVVTERIESSTWRSRPSSTSSRRLTHSTVCVLIGSGVLRKSRARRMTCGNGGILAWIPIPSMTGLLESKAIKVIEAELPERFDGLACTVKLVRSQPDTEVVVVSDQTNVERRRFTMAHRAGPPRDTWRQRPGVQP